MLCPRSVNLRLQRAWLALFHPLFGLPLGLRGVEGNGELVHGDYVVESCLGVPLEELKEVLSPLDSLIFLCRGEKFGHPTSGPLYETKIDGEGRLDRHKSKDQIGGQLSNSQAPVILNSTRRQPLQRPQSTWFFSRSSGAGPRWIPLLHSFCNPVYLAFRQGLVPVGSIHQRLYFFTAFSGPCKTGDKIANFCHSAKWRG